MTHDSVITKLLSLQDDDTFWEKRNAEVTAEREQEKREQEEKRKRREAQQWEKIPEVYREDFVPSLSKIGRDAIQHCKAWTPQGIGIGLTGTTGLGKTRLLCAVLRRFRATHTWLYLPAFEMSNHVSNQWNDDDWTAQHAFRQLQLAKRVQILLLDDIGDEKSSQASTDYFKELIEHRTSRKLPILWSTNITREALVAKHGVQGSATVRRLFEYCTRF